MIAVTLAVASPTKQNTRATRVARLAGKVISYPTPVVFRGRHTAAPVFVLLPVGFPSVHDTVIGAAEVPNADAPPNAAAEIRLPPPLLRSFGVKLPTLFHAAQSLYPSPVRFAVVVPADTDSDSCAT